MKIRLLSFLLIAFMAVGTLELNAQVLNPNDPIVEYDADNPPTRPANGEIGKWVRTKRVNWNTDDFKSYYYNGMAFRIRFPENYDASGNTKYPMLVMLHGRGESGSIYDNEKNLTHAASKHQSDVKNGKFDGFLFFPQNTGGFWGNGYFETINDLLTNHFGQINVDNDRIVIHGLSAGGQGVWNYISDYPKTIAAALPMSAASPNYWDGIPSFKYIPIWQSQGGQDRAPTTFTSQALVDKIVEQGGNIRYTVYKNLGHGVWNTHYNEADFWPYINRAHRTNPVVMTGELTLASTSSSRDVFEFYTKNEICPGETIIAKLGIVNGFDAYEWRKDGLLLNTATSNELEVTEFGVYDVRFSDNGTWSAWSKTPVEIKEKTGTVTPDIIVSGLNSKVLPSPDGQVTVPLELPEGYIEYGWKKEGTNTILSTERIFYAADAGNYVATVTEKFGCSSSFSVPFEVINANGLNKPDALSSIAAHALSKTSIKLQWATNTGSAYPASNYEVYRSTTSGTNYKLIAMLSSSSVEYIDEGLSANTQYYYIVRPVNDFAAATVSSEASVRTEVDALAPTPPLNLSVIGTSSNSITLTWDESTDDVGVYRYDVYKDGIKSIVAPENIATLYNLVEGKSYQFMVRARDLTGNESPFSNMIVAVAVANGLNYKFYNKTWGSNLPDFKTLTPLESGLIPNFDISGRTQNSNYGYLFEGEINIPVAGDYTFETRSDDGSKLYIGGYDENYLVVNNDGAHGMRYREGTYTFPTAGSYKIAVSFYQGGGGQGLEVYWKNTAHGVTSRQRIPDSAFYGQFELDGNPPVSPSNLVANAVSYQSIQLSWTDNSSDESGFQVFRSTDPAGPFVPVSLVSANTTTFTDSKLEGATTYYYQVVSLNKYGASHEVKAAYTLLGDVNSGIAAIDNANGTGFIMYSEQNVFSRFSSNRPNSSNSDHLIAVKFENGTWFYDNNSNLYPFTLDESDLLLASVDFSADQIVSLEGSSSTFEGIEMGYASGDLMFYADRWNGGNNDGEFTITGTYFERNNSGVAVATTNALPAIPGLVNNLLATANSISQITLSWDNSAGSESYSISRSNDGETFLPLAIVNETGLNSYSFIDNGLQTHTTYYYKVSAVNAGGSSEGVSVSATTLNNAPELSDLPSELTIRYDSEYDVSLYGTDEDGDQLTITGSNLPSFASLVDYGDGSGLLRFSPVESDLAGSPYTEIVVSLSDAFGGVSSHTLSLVVNNNNLPTLSPVTDLTITEGESSLINIIASDVEGTSNLSWDYDLPSFSQLTINIDGTAALTVSPGFADHGNYSAYISITDLDGAIAREEFLISVTDKDPNEQVFVNFRQNTNAGSGWNNIGGLGVHALTTSAGASSGASLELQTGSWKVFNQGAQTGNNSGVFPDAVLRDYYYFGIFGAPETVTMKLSGLDPNITYNYSFVGSSIWTGVPDNGTTVYTIGTTSASVNTQNNRNSSANINGVKPNASGEVYVVMSKAAGTPAGYLNGFSMSSVYGADEVPTAPRSLQAVLSGSSVALTWIDAPYNETGFNVYRSETSSGPYTQIGTVGSGVEAYSDGDITEGLTYYYVVSAYNGVGESVYSEEISFTAPNTPPSITIAGETDLSVNVSSTIEVTISDSPTNTLSVLVSGMPSFGSYLNKSTGVTMSFNPSLSDIGSYTVTVDATDNYGASSSRTINLTVSEETLYSVSLNFGRNSMAASPWNNTAKAPAQGDVFGNLKDEKGQNTGISVSLQTAFGGSFNEGATTGDDSGVVPDNVLREYYYWGIFGAPEEVSMKVSGLDYRNKYTVSFVASSTFRGSGVTDNGETVYEIGNKSVSLDVESNTDRMVTISGVTASHQGELIIKMSKGLGARVGYIGGLVITAHAGDPSIFYPGDLKAQALDASSIGLSWTDNSFNEQGFLLYRASTEAGPYTMIGTVGAGVTNYVDAGLPKGDIFYYKLRAYFRGGTYSPYTAAVASGTISYYVYVNVNGVPQYDADVPWNNLSVAAAEGEIFTGFKNEEGVVTGMYMEVGTGMQGSNDWGASTGDNSGVYPDAVMKSFYFNDRFDPAGVFTLKGLDLSYNYNLKFFGSIVTGFDIVTNFSAGGYTVSNNQTDNISEVSTIYGLEASADGEITFTVQEAPNSTWAIFNAFVLEAYPKETVDVFARNTASTSNVIVGDYEVRYGKTNAKVSYYPNPANGYFNIKIEEAPMAEARITMHDLTGRVIFTKSQFLNELNTEIRIDNEIGGLQQGMYLFTVEIAGEQHTNRIIIR